MKNISCTSNKCQNWLYWGLPSTIPACVELVSHSPCCKIDEDTNAFVVTTVSLHLLCFVFCFFFLPAVIFRQTPHNYYECSSTVRCVLPTWNKCTGRKKNKIKRRSQREQIFSTGVMKSHEIKVGTHLQLLQLMSWQAFMRKKKIRKKKLNFLHRWMREQIRQAERYAFLCSCSKLQNLLSFGCYYRSPPL